MIDLNALDIRAASPAVWREIDGLREKLRRFDELEAVVQCRRTEGNFDLGWHTIAAFDSKAVAIRYAGECRADGPPCFEYRVISPCAPLGAAPYRLRRAGGHGLSDAPQIKAGQIWKEVDPRLERLVRIIQVGEPTSSSPGFVQIECVLMGPNGWQRKSRTGVTRARAARFNGKRGGYALHEDVP